MLPDVADFDEDVTCNDSCIEILTKLDITNSNVYNRSDLPGDVETSDRKYKINFLTFPFTQDHILVKFIVMY